MEAPIVFEVVWFYLPTEKRGGKGGDEYGGVIEIG